MRCISCHRLSRDVVCRSCRNRLLTPAVSRRTVGTLEVVSLFGYRTLEPFLLTKHTPVGHRMYHYLGKHFLSPFLSEFADKLPPGSLVQIIGVDEYAGGGYSHTARLIHAVKHPSLEVIHGKLLARNRVTYAGKTLQYRLENPRKFRYTGPCGGEAILVDDIVTTGLTLQQARQTLLANGVDILYAVTLANAQQ